MKETAVPSMWPLCHLGAQTPGRPDTRGGHGGRAPPSSSTWAPGTALRLGLARTTWYLPAWLAAPNCACHQALGTSLGALAQLCKLAEHPPCESDRPGSRGVGDAGAARALSLVFTPRRPAPLGSMSSSCFRQ